MTEKPLVSVIINCYNSEKYLRETIDSLIAQTYDNWEAIFWDNCSTDKTAEIIASYNEPRFRYFLAEKNTPLGEARNRAMERINGVYFCFLDSDDLWETTFLNDCIDILNNTGAGLVYSRFLYFNEERHWLAASYQESGFVPTNKFIESYNLGMSAGVIKKNIVSDNKLFFDGRFSLIEDYDFFIRVAFQTNVYYLQTPLMWYRCHSNNLSLSDNWVNEMSVLADSIDKKSSLYPYRKCISRQTEIYEYNSLVQNKRRSEASAFLLKNIWHNYKLTKYLIIHLFGENFYNHLYGLLKRSKRELYN